MDCIGKCVVTSNSKQDSTCLSYYMHNFSYLFLCPWLVIGIHSGMTEVDGFENRKRVYQSFILDPAQWQWSTIGSVISGIPKFRLTPRTASTYWKRGLANYYSILKQRRTRVFPYKGWDILDHMQKNYRKDKKRLKLLSLRIWYYYMLCGALFELATSTEIKRNPQLFHCNKKTPWDQSAAPKGLWGYRAESGCPVIKTSAWIGGILNKKGTKK